MVSVPDDATPGMFAGDLFLALAAQGRLVLDAADADLLIADLERTLAVVTDRLSLLDRRRRPLCAAHAAQPEIDAAFAEQVAPGRLEQALAELPKYVEALRRAKRRPGPAEL
jgi:hypothetical protein